MDSNIKPKRKDEATQNEIYHLRGICKLDNFVCVWNFDVAE